MADVPAKVIPRTLRKTYTASFAPYPKLDASKSHFKGGLLWQFAAPFWLRPAHTINHYEDRHEDKIGKDLFESRYWAHVNNRALAVEAAIKKFDPEMKNVPKATLTKLSEAKSSVQPTYPDDLQNAVADKANGWTYMNRENHFNKTYEMLNCETAFGRNNIMALWFWIAVWCIFNSTFEVTKKVKAAVATVKSVL
jgi:hypothetical protein